MIKEYQMTDEEGKEIIALVKKLIPLNGGIFDSLKNYQEDANRFWDKLAKKYGFIAITARPIPNKCPKYFKAMISEKTAD